MLNISEITWYSLLSIPPVNEQRQGCFCGNFKANILQSMRKHLQGSISDPAKHP